MEREKDQGNDAHTTKSMTLRLDQQLAERLQAMADVEGEPVSEVVRRAIAEHVEQRRKDPDFQRMLKRNLERHKRLLEMLADS